MSHARNFARSSACWNFFLFRYFLITPKLLTGLKYHPLMRVLIINNGDYVPSRLKRERTKFPSPSFFFMTNGSCSQQSPTTFEHILARLDERRLEAKVK